jgi:hypothetical protein
MVIAKVLLVVLVVGVYTLCCMIVGATFALKVNEKSKESEKTEENLLPRMLAVGLPYNTLDENEVEKMLGSLSVGLREHVVISTYTTKRDDIEFLWFENSGNTGNPYPEAMDLFMENGEIIAEKIMKDESLQWQVGKA